MAKSSIAIISFLLLASIILTSAKNCQHCSKIKVKINPVCGTDDLTYSNIQELRCYNRCEGTDVKVKAEGECQCLCPNTRESRPVCASNGRTYGNPGEVRCFNQCHKQQIYTVRERPC